MCEEPGELSQLDLTALFTEFPGLQDIDAQLASEAGQSGRRTVPIVGHLAAQLVVVHLRFSARSQYRFAVMTDAVIELDQVTFRWPGHAADTVAIDELHLKSGEHLFVRGGQRQRKTTLLNLLAGIHTPTTARGPAARYQYRGALTQAGAIGFGPTVLGSCFSSSTCFLTFR